MTNPKFFVAVLQRTSDASKFFLNVNHFWVESIENAKLFGSEEQAIQAAINEYPHLAHAVTAELSLYHCVIQHNK